MNSSLIQQVQVEVFWVVIPCIVMVGYQWEIAWTYKMLVSYHNTTWHHNQEDFSFNLYHHENLKFHTIHQVLT